MGTKLKLYTLRCSLTGESQEVIVCEQHASNMPLIDGDLVTAVAAADEELICEFCPEHSALQERLLFGRYYQVRKT